MSARSVCRPNLSLFAALIAPAVEDVFVHEEGVVVVGAERPEPHGSARCEMPALVIVLRDVRAEADPLGAIEDLVRIGGVFRSHPAYAQARRLPVLTVPPLPSARSIRPRPPSWRPQKGGRLYAASIGPETRAFLFCKMKTDSAREVRRDGPNGPCSRRRRPCDACRIGPDGNGSQPLLGDHACVRRL